MDYSFYYSNKYLKPMLLLMFFFRLDSKMEHWCHVCAEAVQCSFFSFGSVQNRGTFSGLKSFT